MSKIQSYFIDRLGLTDAVAIARKKTVPLHRHSFWYYWGGITLFGFIVQVLTGVLLMVYYRAGAEAHESVRQITYEIPFGWLIRSVHNWAANLFVLSIMIHMVSVFFMKAYRSPREFGWVTGMFLLFIGLMFGFSGYLLPMDDLSFFATKVGLEIPNAVPVVGPPIANLLRGGLEVGQFTVQRFFALHVVIFPLLFLPLLALHLWLVQKHGNALPESEEDRPVAERKSMPFFPNFLAKDLAMWLIALNLIAVFAALFPWQLGEPADALKSAPTGIHPDWYFMSQFQMLKVLGGIFPGYLGEALGMGIFTLGLVLWFFIPFYDTTKKNGKRARNATYFGLVAVAVYLLTTIWAYLGVA